MGTEIAKTRPALVVSNDIGNQYAARDIVSPILTHRTDKIYPFEVAVAAGEGGLTRAVEGRFGPDPFSR